MKVEITEQNSIQITMSDKETYKLIGYLTMTLRIYVDNPHLPYRDEKVSHLINWKDSLVNTLRIVRS